MDHDNGMLTVEDAAKLLGTTERFVRRLIAERRIAFVRYGRPGSPVRIARVDLDAFVRAGRVEVMGRGELRHVVRGVA